MPCSKFAGASSLLQVRLMSGDIVTQTFLAASYREQITVQRFAPVTRKRQNQALLESMDRRAKMLVRLQQTVEELSVAAISYYVVGLIGYGARAVKGAGVELNPDLVMRLSIPLVATAIALVLRRTRRAMSRSTVGSE